MDNNISKGKRGELLANDYLKKNGYKIIEMNYRNQIGEIDIISYKDNILNFVEVKTRTSFKYGYAFEAVNRKKQNKIIKTSMVYIKWKNIKNIQFRYDIIEVYLMGNIKINHIKNAFY